jgi:Leucine-rich repeat (LRR) protein
MRLLEQYFMTRVLTFPQLGSLPSTLPHLPNLLTVHLSHNKFREFPTVLLEVRTP